MYKFTFDIPTDWTESPLKDVLDSLSSGSRPKGGGNERDIGVLSLGGEHITDDGLFDLSNPQYVPEGYFGEISEEAEITVGDILINKDGAKTGKLAIIRENFSRFPACINEHLFRLRVKKELINSEYLFAFLYSALGQYQIQGEIQGSAQGGINRRFAKHVRVLYPKNIREQSTIVNVILATDEAIARTRDELEAARCLKAALMQQLFTKGILGRHKSFLKTKWLNIPSCWDIKKLIDLAEVTSGFTMGRDLSRYECVTVPYVTVVNVQDGYFDLSNVSTVQIKETELETGTLRPGDVLMTEGGDRDKLGRGAIWNGEIESCAYQNHIFRIRFHDETYKPKLFHFLLQSWQAKNYFFAHAKQTSNLCTVNSRELKKFPIGVPDPGEQVQMLEMFESVEKVLLTLQGSPPVKCCSSQLMS